MHIIAFILALVAVVLFLVHAARTRPWHFGWVGLAVLTIAWMVQVIITTGSRVTIH